MFAPSLLYLTVKPVYLILRFWSSKCSVNILIESFDSAGRLLISLLFILLKKFCCSFFFSIRYDSPAVCWTTASPPIRFNFAKFQFGLRKKIHYYYICLVCCVFFSRVFCFGAGCCQWPLFLVYFMWHGVIAQSWIMIIVKYIVWRVCELWIVNSCRIGTSPVRSKWIYLMDALTKWNETIKKNNNIFWARRRISQIQVIACFDFIAFQ